MMVTDFLRNITKGGERHGGPKNCRDINHNPPDPSRDINKSPSPLHNPDDDPVHQDQEDDDGYYSPAIYREDEEYYGSPPESIDDALILFTTSFIEEEVIRNCIDEINHDYIRSKEWELLWLAAKSRFRV
ncbi:MAG TPA: hypothetical protein PKI66_05660 [Methanobacteriaceae archaeon]|nr:hypothetical protein [Methanobacteriaceae archaeon]HNS25369.1 hypothetical protein [Methanobacteriaceae archaeon]